MKPGDLVIVTDSEDFDPRVRGKIGIVVDKSLKFENLVTVLVEGRIFGFFPEHVSLLEAQSGSVGSNEL